MAKGKRVLIVEDHAVLRKLMRSLFEANGFQVWDAADGAEGVRMAQELQPDGVILDLAMPVMNGLEAAQILKERTPRTPLIMFTSNSALTLKQALASGISAIVLKSEGAAQLVEKAHALFN
jgi:CheY-like chemotaxis protein